ncbi:MAG: hypothetical protein AB8I08_34370 [Sandaracinaceae bacterium]
MLAAIPPAARRLIPPVVLGLASLSTLVAAVQLWLFEPLLGASFLCAALLQGAGAYGLYQRRFWARGFGVGALLSSGIGVGIWLTPTGIAISSTLLAVLLLVTDDAPGLYERRTAFLERRKLDRSGAKRLFWVGLALGVGLPSLLGSSLSVSLMLGAPLPTAIAAALGVLAFVGFTRLASWCYFALAGATLSMVVAVVLTMLDGAGGAWGALLTATLAAAMLPLTGPVVRALRR